MSEVGEAGWQWPGAWPSCPPCHFWAPTLVFPSVPGPWPVQGLSSVYSLFPTMPRHNLHKIAPLVKSLCAKHGIPYQEKPLLQALLDIIR